MVKESDQLHAPVSVLYHQKFKTQALLDSYLEENKDQLQCIVGEGYLDFGATQTPDILDYPDGEDIRLFIDRL